MTSLTGWSQMRCLATWLWLVSQLLATAAGYELLYAVNAGGEEFVDSLGVSYERDPLMDKGVGTASDYGRNLMQIGRVEHRPDEYLYQTERYHTATFGYEIPVRADGEYLLQLKFCEVYFNAPNLKVFDVLLNQEHTVVGDLDIFREVGRGVAHDEQIRFSVRHGRLQYGAGQSAIRNGRVRVDFIKGYRDNPKINAIALFRGADLDLVPQLPPLDDEPWLDETLPNPAAPHQPKQQQKKANRAQQQQQQQQRDREEADGDVDGWGDEDEDEYQAAQRQPHTVHTSTTPAGGVGGAGARKTSGPKQVDPYALDDSSVMLPVFIAIGAFIPLLFCLCKL